MQDRLFAVGATRFNVGLSAILKMTTPAGVNNVMVKILSGGGTLEIAPLPIALTGTSAAGWGIGYPIGGSEVVSVRGPANFYLAATGATMVAAVAWGYVAGNHIGGATLI